jgi:N-acyl-D-amino-acid deacylase
MAGLLLTGGTVFDGLGASGRMADVAVVDGRVAGIGNAGDAPAGLSRDPWDALCDLVADDLGASIVVRLLHEDDVRAIMASPLVGVGSDNGPPSSGAAGRAPGLEHPRTWGCFPRLLGRHVRELGLLSWEEAVRKATWLGGRLVVEDGQFTGRRAGRVLGRR